jgi:hypothetical protein
LFSLLCLLLVLGGCERSARIVLVHPETRKIVRCEGELDVEDGDRSVAEKTQSMSRRVREMCARNYEALGYVRIDALTSEETAAPESK